MRHLLKLLLSAGLISVLAISCSKDDGGSRLEVFSHDGKKLSTKFIAPVEGGTFTLTAKSGEELDVFYNEGTDGVSTWFELDDVVKTGAGKYQVKFTIQPLVGTLALRNGTLSFSAPKAYLGKFLDVRQGYAQIYQDKFSSETDKCLALAPGEFWQSGLLTGISALKDAWLSFDARAESGSGDVPLEVEILGGAEFPEIARSVYVTDIAGAGEFDSTCFYKLHVYNGGKVFSSETKIRFSVPSDAGSVIYIDNLTIYEIPVTSGINGNDDEEQDAESEE